MDEQSKTKLDAILRTEPAALTDEDKLFLRARSSYLTINQREVYAEVLSAPEVSEPIAAEVPEEPEVSEPVEALKKTKKTK